MADKDDFSFDKDQEVSPEASATEAATAGKKEQKVPSRSLLFGVLLVVLGAAAYLYSVEMMAPENVAVPAAVTKQLITPPPAQVPAVAPAPATEATPAPVTEAAPVGKEGQAPSPAADTPPAPAANQAAIPQEVPKLAEKGVLKEVPVEVPPAPVEPAAASPTKPAGAPASSDQAQAKQAEPAVMASDAGSKNQTASLGGQPAREAYTLLAGAYISPDLLQSATRKVKALGYQPRTLKDRKQVEMTRMRLGAFPPEVAKARLVELKKLAPEAFSLPEGDLVAVYAASHYDAAASRTFAEHLRQAGVVAEEEKVVLKLPMTELFFGEFADKETAELAAAKARKAGLDIVVFKRP